MIVYTRLTLPDELVPVITEATVQIQNRIFREGEEIKLAIMPECQLPYVFDRSESEPFYRKLQYGTAYFIVDRGRKVLDRVELPDDWNSEPVR